MALKNKIVTKSNKLVTVSNKVSTGCGGCVYCAFTGCVSGQIACPFASPSSVSTGYPSTITFPAGFTLPTTCTPSVSSETLSRVGPSSTCDYLGSGSQCIAGYFFIGQTQVGGNFSGGSTILANTQQFNGSDCAAWMWFSSFTTGSGGTFKTYYMVYAKQRTVFFDSATGTYCFLGIYQFTTPGGVNTFTLVSGACADATLVVS